jgi:N-acetylmuramoyl-L-alanine amidase
MPSTLSELIKMTTLRGKVSWFGGPDDTGVSPSEGLAFYYDVSDAPELFLDHQPSGTTGLARRLDPEAYYIACRWNYATTPKTMLPKMKVKVTNPKNGYIALAVPGDWGPHEDTGRCADISPGLMAQLELDTDDEVIVEYQPIGAVTMPYERIMISSGHGLKVRGAHGILDEVDEARRVVEHLADELRERGVHVEIFHDDVSTTQSQNLDRIVSTHNSKDRDLDISVHFNAYEQVSKPMGTEVLYITQGALAGRLSAAIASCGFIDRGPKKRTDLAFLNGTEEPAVLLEICFVDSEADADLYSKTFDEICEALADELGGTLDGEEVEPPDVEEPIPGIVPRIDIEVEGEVIITVNGIQVTQ